jgi:hypothetical protein
VVDIVNVRLWDPEDNDYEIDVGEVVTNAWTKSQWKMKINASVGCLLVHKESGRYRYFHSSSNNACLFERPRLISSLAELDSLIDDVVSTDLQHESVKRRPNTQWRLHAVTNLTFYLYKLIDISRVGANVDLPDYVRRNKSLFTLDYNRHTKREYNDRLCFFRCLALAKECHCRPVCKCKRVSERLAKSLRDEFLQSTGRSAVFFVVFTKKIC